MATHPGALEKAGYIAVQKDFVGKKPRTRVSLTRAGPQGVREARAVSEGPAGGGFWSSRATSSRPRSADAAVFGFDIRRRCERLRDAAGNVDDVGGLGEARDQVAQLAHEVLPLLHCRTEMAGAGREVGVVQIVGLDAAFHESARISSLSVSMSSLTPLSSTVWLSSGMPASARRAQAARTAGGELARVVAVDVRHRPLFMASGSPRRTRSKCAADRRRACVCQRITFTCGMASSSRVSAEARRADSMNGSPPVRITSQISDGTRI